MSESERKDGVSACESMAFTYMELWDLAEGLDALVSKRLRETVEVLPHGRDDHERDIENIKALKRRIEERDDVSAAVRSVEGRGLHFRRGSELRFATDDEDGEDGEVFAGDRFLVCVKLCKHDDPRKTWNDWVVVTCTETGWDVYDESWDLDWSDVEWFVPVKELDAILAKLGDEP